MVPDHNAGALRHRGVSQCDAIRADTAHDDVRTRAGRDGIRPAQGRAEADN